MEEWSRPAQGGAVRSWSNRPKREGTQSCREGLSVFIFATPPVIRALMGTWHPWELSLHPVIPEHYSPTKEMNLFMWGRPMYENTSRLKYGKPRTGSPLVLTLVCERQDFINSLGSCLLSGPLKHWAARMQFGGQWVGRGNDAQSHSSRAPRSLFPGNSPQILRNTMSLSS